MISYVVSRRSHCLFLINLWRVTEFKPGCWKVYILTDCSLGVYKNVKCNSVTLVINNYLHYLTVERTSKSLSYWVFFPFKCYVIHFFLIIFVKYEILQVWLLENIFCELFTHHPPSAALFNFLWQFAHSKNFKLPRFLRGFQVRILLQTY